MGVERGGEPDVGVGRLFDLPRSNRAPSKRIRGALDHPRQPVHEGPHRPLDARLRPEEKPRECPSPCGRLLTSPPS